MLFVNQCFVLMYAYVPAPASAVDVASAMVNSHVQRSSFNHLTSGTTKSAYDLSSFPKNKILCTTGASTALSAAVPSAPKYAVANASSIAFGKNLNAKNALKSTAEPINGN